MGTDFGTNPLRCHFCGRLPEVKKTSGLRAYVVRCSNKYCAARPSVCGSSRRLATLMWNRRDG